MRILLSILLLIGASASGADSFVFNTLADLIAAPTSSQQPNFEVKGYRTIGDWGASRMGHYDKTGTAATNLGCVFNATPSGQWVFEDCESGQVDVRWFGGTNDVATLAYALSWVLSRDAEVELVNRAIYLSDGVAPTPAPNTLALYATNIAGVHELAIMHGGGSNDIVATKAWVGTGGSSTTSAYVDLLFGTNIWRQSITAVISSGGIDIPVLQWSQVLSSTSPLSYIDLMFGSDVWRQSIVAVVNSGGIDIPIVGWAKTSGSALTYYDLAFVGNTWRTYITNTVVSGGFELPVVVMSNIGSTGSGVGSVTSVAAVSTISSLGFAGSPITTSGTLTLTGLVASASLVPTGISPGIYTNPIVTFDAGGRATSASSIVGIPGSGTVVSVGATSSVPGLGFTGSPFTVAGTLVLTGSVVSVTTELLFTPTFYARVGREANIYFENVVRSTVPLIEQNVDITCDIGGQYSSFGGFWRHTPVDADVGIHAWNFAVRDAGTMVASISGDMEVKVIATHHPTNAPVTRNVLCVGDSLWASGSTLAEMVRADQGDTNFTLVLVGSSNGNVLDSASVSRAVSCDAIAGWTSERFHINTSTVWNEIDGSSRTGSPFVVSGVFNITNYMSTYSVTLASNDWMLINLGANDVEGATNDTDAAFKIADSQVHYDAIVEGFRAAVPGIRIGICPLLPVNASQDAFGVGLDSGRTRFRTNRSRDQLIAYLIATYGGRTAEGIYLFPYHAVLDSYNNFGTVNAPVNAYNSTTFKLAFSSAYVHPALSGYWQLGDSLYNMVVGVE